MKSQNNYFLAALFVLLSAFVILSYFCHPAADDFEGAASSAGIGFWKSYLRDLQVTNGRYTDGFFAFASPLRWGSVGLYKVCPVLLMGLSYFALFFALKTILNPVYPGITIHLFSSVLLLLYLSIAPSFTESFYWYSSSVTYQLPGSLTLLYFSLLIRKPLRFGRPFHFLILVVLAAVIIGFNEVNMLLMVAGSLIFSFCNGRSESENKLEPVLLFILVLAFSSVLIFSPGNAGRLALFQVHHRLLHSLHWSCLQTMRFMIGWMSRIPFLIASFLFIPLCTEVRNRIRLGQNKYAVPSLLIVLAMPASVFLCIFPAYWATDILGQQRTVNVACFFFIPLWFASLSLFADRLKGYSDSVKKFRKVFAAVFILSFFLCGNSSIVIADLLSGRAAAFNEEMFQRYRTIQAGVKSGQPEVVVENLSTKPQSLCVYDITCDPGFWINKCTADYFTIGKVRLKTCE